MLCFKPANRSISDFLFPGRLFNYSEGMARNNASCCNGSPYNIYRKSCCFDQYLVAPKKSSEICCANSTRGSSYIVIVHTIIIIIWSHLLVQMLPSSRSILHLRRYSSHISVSIRARCLSLKASVDCHLFLEVNFIKRSYPWLSMGSGDN